MVRMYKDDDKEKEESKVKWRKMHQLNDIQSHYFVFSIISHEKSSQLRSVFSFIPTFTRSFGNNNLFRLIVLAHTLIRSLITKQKNTKRRFYYCTKQCSGKKTWHCIRFQSDYENNVHFPTIKCYFLSVRIRMFFFICFDKE